MILGLQFSTSYHYHPPHTLLHTSHGNTIRTVHLDDLGCVIMSTNTVKLAEYLFTRLRQLGIKGIHGVPGDYNLTLLDYVTPQGLQWIGNCNELNAGYAADAYARIKGVGALITTFGVGELSAINAIAGAYAELAPVVHIVGTPARFKQEDRALIHHTLGDGEYLHFAKMAEHVTVAQANLLDPRLAPQQIDATLQQCLLHSRPVYIQVPVDMVDASVSANQLETSIRLPTVSSVAEEEAALQNVLERIYASKRPMIFVDGEIQAYDVLKEVNELIRQSSWPTWISAFAKGLVNESLPNFHGIWKGSYSTPQDAEYIGSADLILCVGPHFSGTNTYLYTAIPDATKTIHFKATSVQTSLKQTYRDLPAKHFLQTLLQRCDFSRLQKDVPAPTVDVITKPDVSPPRPLTQDSFWRFFGAYLRPGDIVLAETGTAGHGCREFHLPPHTYLFKPSTWLSIGYMLPATQGAALAQRELANDDKWQGVSGDRSARTILFIGDGSFQMTAQELSTIIRHELNVMIVLINNDGYTIERCIHGYKADYNDVAFWRYLKAPEFFGAPDQPTQSGYHSITAQAKTWGELQDILEEKDDGKPALRMFEVFMEKLDAPVSLLGLGGIPSHLQKR